MRRLAVAAVILTVLADRRLVGEDDVRAVQDVDRAYESAYVDFPLDEPEPVELGVAGQGVSGGACHPLTMARGDRAGQGSSP